MGNQVMNQVEVLKGIVEEKYESWIEKGSIFDGIAITAGEKEHIISIGTSILQTKFEVGFKGGGFVQAVVGNDLSRAIGNADSTNVKAIKFYVMLMYNVGNPF
tara:strand:- start:2890 stop:3198 length:309 start_codon:yes stop_codon:yes gene_type:complete